MIAGDLGAVAKVVRALRTLTRRLRFVYEADPCGFGIHRYLTAGVGVRRRESLEHAETERRSDQDRSARRRRPRPIASRRRAGWTTPYRRWLADVSFTLAPQHIAMQEYHRDTIDETECRVERLTDQLRQLTPAWRWASSPRSATFDGSPIRAS